MLSAPFDYIENLPRRPPSERTFEEWLDKRKAPVPRDPPIRPSHLKARRYHPTHPLLKISKKLPRKLTPKQLEALPHDELARRFLLATSKFQWNPRSVWS